jgi:hypothetical protein
VIAEIPKELIDIARRMALQDNRCTANPMFCVQGRRGEKTWETLAVCFSEKGCEEHLLENGHNYRHYKETRIYAESFNRNPEMIAIRQFLMRIGGKG